jgi:predicted O-methyltransferase YrrM
MGVFFDLYRGVYLGLERLGVHLTPVHYHFPLPDAGRLPESLWAPPQDPAGIDFREESQLDLLAVLAADYRAEYERFPAKPPAVAEGFHLENGHFEAVDAEILYSLVRHRRPRRFFEIGSGYSTLLALQAGGVNGALGHPCSITVFDPHPSPLLTTATSRPVTVRREPVERVSLETFDALDDGDILFIDSSHVVAIGSDVRRLILDVIPRLRPGVLVHVHDVFLPAEYPRYWVKNRLRFWNEQYLLQAFLVFNERFQVVWGSHLMALRHPDALAEAIPSFQPRQWPGSFWFSRTR